LTTESTDPRYCLNIGIEILFYNTYVQRK